MNAPMVAVSSLAEVKVPRRMAWRVLMEKKHSSPAWLVHRCAPLRAVRRGP
jgi:hypothetical protein